MLRPIRGSLRLPGRGSNVLNRQSPSWNSLLKPTPIAAGSSSSSSPSQPSLRTFSSSKPLSSPPKRSSKPAKDTSTPDPAHHEPVTSAGPNVVTQKTEAPRKETPTPEEVTVAPGLPETKDAGKTRAERLPLRMPEPRQEEQVEQVIPLTPDNFRVQSKPQPEPDETTPKVMTVASISTHPAGGPSHNIHATADNDQIDSPDSDTAPSTNSDSDSDTTGIPSPVEMLSSAGSAFQSILPPLGAPKGDAPMGEYKPPNRPLNHEERRGLWVLGGVVAAGLLLGGPKKDKKPKRKTDNEQH